MAREQFLEDDSRFQIPDSRFQNEDKAPLEAARAELPSTVANAFRPAMADKQGTQRSRLQGRTAGENLKTGKERSSFRKARSDYPESILDSHREPDIARSDLDGLYRYIGKQLDPIGGMNGVCFLVER